MACVCCGETREAGPLCKACWFAVAPCEGLIAEHIRSCVDPTEAQAWLVDAFGGAHAIGSVTGIGRNPKGDVVVLASSVSREHAELRLTPAGWTARDLGSRNGTFVNGGRIEGQVELAPRVVIKLGDVALWFVTTLHEESLKPE